MRQLALFAAIATFPAAALADVVGNWRTESDKASAYLEIAIGPCASDASKYCGTVAKAFTSAGEDPGYENIGKLIIENMTDDGGGKFSGGTIWDPERDKTFRSHMTLKGDDLDVEGCVAILCDGQDWKRVK